MGRTTKVLANDLAAELKLPTRTARQFVQRLLEMVEDDRVTSDHVELRGLGTFAVCTNERPCCGRGVAGSRGPLPATP